jgi:NAD(P)H-nitrite reductase large subunit
MPSPKAERGAATMTRRYVVIGNGIAGQTAAEELRKADADAPIVMLAAERHPLYNRVALPRYLRGQVRREKVLMRTVEDYARQNLEIHFETWATEIDVKAKVVRTNRAQEFPYDALLIATGGRPKPPPWPGSDEVSACLGFQTLDDTDAIIEKADASERVLVMGGSFIGYELAEGVSFRKKSQLTWIMRGPWFLRYVLDEEGGQLCRQMGEAQGVEFITSDEVQKFSRTNGRFHAETVNGKHVDFNLLTYGVGLDYYIEPLRDTGIELNKGIVTDAKLRTAAPDVYAAGDVAVFYDLMVERHNQMGTWDNAEAHGKVAARNMAGADEDFFDVPTYTTTMFGSTLAVMGVTPDVQPGLESVRTYSLEEKFYRKLFFKDDRLVGAIMIGPPKGRKKLIEIMRSRNRIERPKQELLDPNNLKD